MGRLDVVDRATGAGSALGPSISDDLVRTPNFAPDGPPRLQKRRSAQRSAATYSHGGVQEAGGLTPTVRSLPKFRYRSSNAATHAASVT
jgi:hypothetical protein